jgi:hypothetical protein
MKFRIFSLEYFDMYIRHYYYNNLPILKIKNFLGGKSNINS